jgi:hypothetical protein
MGGYWYPDMLDVLRAAGCKVAENGTTDGWQYRSRSSGGFPAPPLAVWWHHTASSTTPESDLAWMINGCDDAPVGNLLLDRTGCYWPVAAGASNCAGKGGPATFSRGTVPLDQGNTYGFQIEAANNGVGEAWPAAQLDAYFAGSNALNAHVGNQPADVITHNVWAPTRKIDPATAAAVEGAWRPSSTTSSGTWSLDEIRSECALRAITTPEVDVPLTDDEINRIAKAAADQVWARLVSVPDKDPQAAVWVLGQTYILSQRTVKALES